MPDFDWRIHLSLTGAVVQWTSITRHPEKDIGILDATYRRFVMLITKAVAFVRVILCSGPSRRAKMRLGSEAAASEIK